MNFDALKEYTGWKSPRVFIKHYVIQIEALKFHTVAVGKIVHPDNPENVDDSN